MPFDVERLLRLWTNPLPDDEDRAVRGFQEVYTDPVTVNGAPVSGRDMVARARALQAAIATSEREVLDVVQGDGATAVAFRLTGRHVGPLATSAGTLAPTGEVVTLRVIDILHVTDGLITGVWMVADELGALSRIDAVTLGRPQQQNS